MQDIFSTRHKKFGEIAIEKGFITQAQLDKALSLQKNSSRRLGEILTENGALTSMDVAEILAEQLNVPFLRLERYRPDYDAVKIIPRAIAERLKIIPLKFEENNELFITMADPLNLPAYDEIKRISRRDIKIAVSGLDDLIKNLSRIYNFSSNLESALLDTQIHSEIYTPLSATTTVSNPDDASIIGLVNDTIARAVRENASDIHFEVYENSSRIRFRVDGSLYVANEYTSELHPAVISRIKIISGMDIAERRRPQDGRILTSIDGRNIDLRVSSLPTMSGEKIVLRILDRDNSFVELEKLGLDARDMNDIENFCSMPYGILLATGPTGSGKSTTLYSMLKKINNNDINIITVEDPVEFHVPGINQISVNERAGLTFATALRSILRQDPDKIMIGEIRDTETAEIAIRAALTGHFVLSTLHTNDAPSAAARIIDMGIQPFLLSASLSGIIAQRLVRCLCPFCREEYELDENTCEKINVPSHSHAFRAIGCRKCRNGYRGRRGIFEILTMNNEMREMILKGASDIEFRNAAVKNGMKTLRQSGINAALAGYTSFEEILSVTR